MAKRLQPHCLHGAALPGVYGMGKWWALRGWVQVQRGFFIPRAEDACR